MQSFIRRLYLLGFVFALAVGINTFFTHKNLEESLQREISRSISFKLENITEQISAELANANTMLDAARGLISMEADESTIAKFFNSMLAVNSSYLAMFLTTTENKTIYVNDWTPPDAFDARLRPWYTAAVQAGDLIFTTPYLDAAAERWVLTAAKPVYKDEGELFAVVGIDKSLQEMLEFFEQGRPSPMGHTFLFNQQGIVLLCSSCGTDEISTIASLFGLEEDPLLEQTSGLDQVQIEGQAGYLRWREVPGLGLKVGAFAPLSDFYDPGALNRQLFWTTLISSGVIFGALFFLQNQHVIKPLRELDRDIMAISVDTNREYRLPILAKHSFRPLRETINRSLDRTQDHFEQILHQQEELASAYEQLVAHEEELQQSYLEIKQHQARIRYLADHDSLTGLYNRRKFRENLIEVLNQERTGALLMLDIDNFKNINDIHGHVYGDRVLRSVAQLFRRNLPSRAIAYRFGGDEFLIVLLDSSHDSIHKLITQITTLLGEIEVVKGRRAHITASIGVARFPYDGNTVDELLIKADIAMYNAKNKGKDRYLFFEGEMAATFNQRVQVERILFEAIQANAFTLLYQPIIKTSTGEVACFEALLRLKNHDISPNVFIPIAEETNLIVPIGRWVIKEAVSQLASWERQGLKPKAISVNLSAKQFYDEGLVNYLATELASYSVDPSQLEMEITETVFIDNMDEAIEIIKKIKHLGVKMSLDDFGVGYSSINYITRLPVDRIKLDRSLTEKLGENISVLEGVTAIAHGLGMDVVGEGVENMEEAALLHEVGCDYLQGYLFSVPLPIHEIAAIYDHNYLSLL